MHRAPSRCRSPRATPILAAAAVLGLCLGGSAASAAAPPNKKAVPPTGSHLGGTWSGSYQGAFTGTFVLRWTQMRTGKLTGAIKLSKPKGTYGITGSVRNGVIKFGAVAVGATYTGSASPSGLKMSGTWASPQGGGSWAAHKTLVVKKTKAKPKPKPKTS